MSGADTAPSMIYTIIHANICLFKQVFILVEIQEIILEQFLNIQFICGMIYIY